MFKTMTKHIYYAHRGIEWSKCQEQFVQNSGLSDMILMQVMYYYMNANVWTNKSDVISVYDIPVY